MSDGERDLLSLCRKAAALRDNAIHLFVCSSVSLSVAKGVTYVSSAVKNFTHRREMYACGGGLLVALVVLEVGHNKRGERVFAVSSQSR